VILPPFLGRLTLAQCSLLYLGGRAVAQTRVQPLTIVEPFHVGEQVGPSLVADGVGAVMHQFGFQGVEGTVRLMIEAVPKVCG
jgi:hypothetical protein